MKAEVHVTKHGVVDHNQSSCTSRPEHRPVNIHGFCQVFPEVRPEDYFELPDYFCKLLTVSGVPNLEQSEANSGEILAAVSATHLGRLDLKHWTSTVSRFPVVLYASCYPKTLAIEPACS
jgi:hypothetical protein